MGVDVDVVKTSKIGGDMFIILQRGQNTPYNKRLNQNEIKQQENGKDLQYKSQKGHENKCYRCGIKGHWSRTCRMPKHLVDLYQASLKEKGKGVKVNLTELIQKITLMPQME